VGFTVLSGPFKTGDLFVWV